MKAPLIGVFYAALIWFAAEFLPRSEEYGAVVGGYVMPMTGLLTLLGYAVLAAAVYAVAFSGARRGGIVFTVMLTVSVCGLQWAVPMLRQLLGEAAGVMTKADMLFQLAGNGGATILTLILATLLYRIPGAHREPHDKDKPEKGKSDATHEPKYKLGIVALISRVPALPILYFILYYVSWYFLFWRREAVYTFYTGADFANLENFMGELIHVLVDRGMEAVLTLLTGLAYAVFSFPLALRMLGRRVLFIIANTLLYILGAVHFLIPDPLLPPEVRMAQLIMNGAVLLVYGALSGLILTTVFRREEAPVQEEPAKPAKKKKVQGQPEQPEQPVQPEKAVAAAKK